MSLLREIQNAATDTNSNLATVLRKCRILAARLHHEPFKEWLDKELNGYAYETEADRQMIPSYRVLHGVQSRGHFSGYFGSGLKNGVIPPSCIPEEWRDNLTTQYLAQGVSAYEELVKNSTSDTFTIPWPADLMGVVGNHVYEDMGCLAAWKVIAPGSLIQLLDTVRNKVLDFALEIEAKAPEAGEASPQQTPVPQEVVNRLFQTIVMGNVGTLVAGSSDFSVQTVNVKHGDIASLQSYLQSLGLAPEDVSELKKAIETDGKPKTADTFGSSVSAWLGKMVGKAASGTLKIGTSVAASVLTKAITHYYGL